MKKLKSIFASFVICLVFTTTSFANKKLEVNCNETVVNTINYEPSVVLTNAEFGTDVVLIKDGKFWRALRDFLIGFGEGFFDVDLPINGNNSNGNNNEEMQNIKEYALKYIRTKENALKMADQIKDLIQSDKKTVSKNEILEILNPKSSGMPNPRWLKELLDDIFKGPGISGTTDNPNSNPISTTKIKRGKVRKLESKKIRRYGKPFNNDKDIIKSKINWRELGRLVGKIVRILIK